MSIAALFLSSAHHASTGQAPNDFREHDMHSFISRRLIMGLPDKKVMIIERRKRAISERAYLAEKNIEVLVKLKQVWFDSAVLEQKSRIPRHLGVGRRAEGVCPQVA